MIKEMLENYMNYKADIKTKELEIRKLELMELSTSGSNFAINGDIRSKGYMNLNTENKIISNVDKVNKLKSEIEILRAKIDMLDSLINTLSDYHREIIELRYKKNKTPKEIGVKLFRVKSTINKAIKEATMQLEEIYNNSSVLRH